MLIVAVKDNESIDKALKKFKKKFERTGVVRELRDRKNFEKRFSPHTVMAYESDLEQFFKYILETYEIENPADVNHSMVRSWIVSMMEHKITPKSITRKVTSLKSFYKFLLRNGDITTNPMQKVQAPKIPKRLPVYVEEQNMKFLFS